MRISYPLVIVISHRPDELVKCIGPTSGSVLSFHHSWMVTWFGGSEMSELIDDRDEAAVVLQSIMQRANLGELLEPLSPSDASLDMLMHVGADEEAEFELLNDDGAGRHHAPR